MKSGTLFIVFQILAALWVSLELALGRHNAKEPTVVSIPLIVNLPFYVIPPLVMFLVPLDYSLNFSQTAYLLNQFSVLSYLGIGLFVLGLSMRFLGRIKLRQYYSPSIKIMRDHKIIKNGVYAFLRHPLYLGMILILLGTTFLFRNLFGIVVLLNVFLPIVFLVIKREERVLLAVFGDEYGRYMDATGGLLPLLRRGAHV